MMDLLSTKIAITLLFVLALGEQNLTTAFACEMVYPSEYAYHMDSVVAIERNGANCRLYAIGLDNRYTGTEKYTHCDGTPLRLTDSALGTEQYSTSDYYVWLDWSSARQLLFIFTARVNLTTIKLHYYSSDGRGLPKLRFYAVPDDFDVWDAPIASYSHVEVAAAPPDGRPAGRRNVTVNLNFTTKRVLLYKYSSSNFAFVVSEVEFNTSCSVLGVTTEASTETTDLSTNDMHMDLETTNSDESGLDIKSFNKNPGTHTTISTDMSATTSTIFSMSGLPTSTKSDSSSNNYIIVVIIAISVILLLIVITTISLILLWRKLKQRKVDYDSSYSTLCRGVQSPSVNTSNELYDQIQLSPSTGQAEFISRNETANTNNPPPHQTEYDIHPSVDKDKHRSAKLKITASTISSQKENKNTPEQPTYAVVNKKNKSHKQSDYRQSQNTAAQPQDVMEKSAVEHGYQLKQSQDEFEADTKLATETNESVQDLYSAVKKKPKERPAEDDIPPPIPKYTVEELYTAVEKVSKTSTAVGDKEAAPQIPPHSIDELYSAVQKKPKASDSKDEEEAPPIPAHTVEELYSAVMKKPKVTIAEDEEEIPQVPPHIMEEL